jgi:hypothetical protein
MKMSKNDLINIIKMYNEDNPSRMSSVATSSGAFYATGNNESP